MLFLSYLRHKEGRSGSSSITDGSENIHLSETSQWVDAV